MGDSSQLGFIVGHYKSGSTWLVNMVSLHPEIRGLAETHVIRKSSEDLARCTEDLFSAVAWADGGRARLLHHRIADWSRPLRRAVGAARGQATLSASERPGTLLDLSVRAQRLLRKKLEACTSSDEYCRTFFWFLHERLVPRRYLIEKTPTNFPWVPRIRELFPEAKLLAVFRDGRDVVVSDQFHLARTKRRTESFEERVLKWQKAMEAQSRYADEFDVCTLRYEDFLADSEGSLRKVLAHLELETSSTTVEDMVRRSSFKFVTQRNSGREKQSDFYRKGVAGDWVERYTDEEKEIFQGIAGDMLVKLGYEESRDWREWRTEKP